MNCLTTRLSFSLGDFTQINLEANRHLVNSVISLLGLKKEDRVLDAFVELGIFALIARSASIVYGVEYSENGVKGAN